MIDTGRYRAALGLAQSPEDLEALAAHLAASLEGDWEAWLSAYFADHTRAPFAPFHREFWEWVWSIRPDVPATSQILCWGRGLAKSTSAELAVVALAARGARRYCLYVGGQAERAGDHVTNIAAMLENEAFGDAYPAVHQRRLSLYGHPRGWRQRRLRTASRFTVDAVGLDAAIRGAKIEADRPDLIVFDDLDDLNDSPETTHKKIAILTKSVLGTGSGDQAVVFVQNLVHPDSIMARLMDGRADFLRGAARSGPIPAFTGLAVDDTPSGWRITAGEPTWAGFGITEAEKVLADTSLAAFRAEYQHEVEVLGGDLFGHLTFDHCAPSEVPELVETAVWVDPAVTASDSSDACAIQVDGWGTDGKLYRLASFEERTTPTLVLRRALLWAYEHGAQVVGVETDQGRDTWASVWREAMSALLAERPDLAGRPEPGFVERQAGVTQQSKAARASQMVPAYEHHRVVHVTGTHELLERALVRFPLRKPYDLVDAAYWGWRYLWDRYAEATDVATDVDVYAMALPR